MQHDRHGQREITGRMVLFGLLAFFAVVLAMNAVLIGAAISTFGGVETESSYKAGLAFARDVAAAQAQDSRAWQVEASLAPAAGGTAIQILARDAGGRPVADVEAAAVVLHPTDQRLDRTVRLTEDAPGRFIGRAALEPGQRDVIIELSRGGERLFRSKTRVVLHGATP
jgi:nitrogen fixation protein FixH